MAGTEREPFIIDDEEEILINAHLRREIDEALRRGQEIARIAGVSHDFPISIDDDDGTIELEVAIEDILADGIGEVIDLTNENELPISGPDALIVRDEGIILDEWRLDNGKIIQTGMALEIAEPLGDHQIQFFRVQQIILPNNQNPIIRGWAFTRTKHLNGILPCKLNEVALIVESSSFDERPWEERALREIPTGAILRERELIITNTPFPEHRFSGWDYKAQGHEWVAANSRLVCRYRFEIQVNPANNKPCEWALIRLSEDEADPDFRIRDEALLNRWRGGKVPGGSSKHGAPQPLVVDIDADVDLQDAHRPVLAPEQRYTAGDVFAGAGGASRGIELAGVQLLFALDHWRPAANTLDANFGDRVNIHFMDVTEFINNENLQYDVDMLHLSPPCQFWSPAHTIAGKNDDDNIAVLYSCEHLIKKLRPRVFTVEQTFGILSPNFTAYFNAFILGFTSFDYSVRWKVVPLANYGIPQLRKRLIMIGAGPGDKLPSIPPPTHSKNRTGGLKPWNTPWSVVGNMAQYRHHPLHRPREVKLAQPRPAWDPTQLARTITCNGGQNYHWSGRRNFTLLEYALLQGFFPDHQFRGSYIKKQIGNAFPSRVVKVLYEHLVSFLLKQDGFDPDTRPGPILGNHWLYWPGNIDDNDNSDGDYETDSDTLDGKDDEIQIIWDSNWNNLGKGTKENPIVLA
ncbi:uncharacterized protein CTHT_0012460 [Thermochaetoides thermophila DSM 1495]|uniref:DNA (cytosine-5-)-methyltransferase n=1 Tax=Chaetomium thermophilum (strain DSM 1495 / CBS 144.50 / IMI 039719) TaxID=759272 RepID=G0S161_CHATD|nr:hypothetical protein CTHT_0012460 [Thermochaetoides thermophila DSM 1495]EGS22771.1 hypothetical protein CTHT_0012460 [Thermochaetoides thermophila DSM 1495]